MVSVLARRLGYRLPEGSAVLIREAVEYLEQAERLNSIDLDTYQREGMYIELGAGYHVLFDGAKGAEKNRYYYKAKAYYFKAIEEAGKNNRRSPAEALKDILDLKQKEADKINRILTDVLHKSRKF